MSIIVRPDWSPEPFEVKLSGRTVRLGGPYGILGQQHPTAPSYVHVEWLDGTPEGFYPRRNLIVLGTALTTPEPTP